MGRTIDGLLGGSGGMDGGHQTLNDTEVVVDNLSERGQAIGSARSIGDLNPIRAEITTSLNDAKFRL